jgi:hypothetical protein
MKLWEMQRMGKWARFAANSQPFVNNMNAL